MFEIFKSLLHIDVTLAGWAQEYGPAIYIILFLIIFCETGLVIMPFLPGDSLLFAVGALTASKNIVELHWIIPLLILAATIGDSLNYFIGRKWGVALFDKNIPLLKKDYLKMTEEFFEKRGVWAVSLARFFPLIRTFAPFFAGISKMSFKRFVLFSFSGSVAWVNLFALAGYFFGQIPVIQKNFTLLVMGIVIFSMLPIVLTAIKSRFLKNS